MPFILRHCEPRDYNPYNYEYPIVFQASSDRKYYLTCMDGNYSYDYDDFFIFEDSTVTICGKEYESPGTMKIETINRIQNTIRFIMGRIYDRKLKYVSFMSMTNHDDDYLFLAVIRIFSDAFYKGQDWINGDFVIDMYSCECGVRWNTPKIPDTVIQYYKKEKKKTLEEEIIEAVNKSKRATDKNTKFSNYLNKIIETRAKDDIDHKRWPVYNKKVDSAINRWKTNFMQEISIHSAPYATVRRIINEGTSLSTNRNLILLIAYKLQMTNLQTRELFSLADLNYDIDIPNEELLKHFIKNELYEYKEIELSEILYQIGCGDIYEAAGFAHVDDENDEDFF